MNTKQLFSGQILKETNVISLSKLKPNTDKPRAFCIAFIYAQAYMQVMVSYKRLFRLMKFTISGILLTQKRVKKKVY